MTSTVSTRSVAVLSSIICWNLISTTLHYTHNFLHAEHYPPVEPFFPNALAYRVGIVVFWPILTAAGVWAYARYRSGRLRGVPTALLAYSLLGFTTILHFLGGTPHIPTVFFISIFTDFLGGLLLIGFAAWLILNRNRGIPRPSRPRT
jgi:hypothetical protein